MLKVLNAEEEVCKFAEEINSYIASPGQKIVLSQFKAITTHDIVENPQNLIAIYTEMKLSAKINIIKTIDLTIKQTIPSVFFDKNFLYEEEDKEDTINAIVFNLNDIFIGMYLIEINTLFLTDFTHDRRTLKIAYTIFPQILEYLYTIIINPSQTIDKLTYNYNLVVKSQKLKGLQYLYTNNKYSLPTIIVNNTGHFSFRNFLVLSRFYADTTCKYPQIFIRTCPQKPRHGILENMIVPLNYHTICQAIDILAKEMIKQGEFPQIAIQPFIPQAVNIVYNNKTFVFGLNNDGVTASNKTTITLPGFTYSKEDKIKKDLKLNSFDLEFILDINDSSLYLTQVRQAPPLRTFTYLPNRSEFFGFIPNQDSYIKLEYYEFVYVKGLENIDILENLDTQKKYLCVHLDGNIVSHASAWCRQRNIPYIALPEKEKNLLLTSKYLIEIRTNIVKFANTPRKIEKNRHIDWYEQEFLNALDKGMIIPFTTNYYGWENYFFFQHYSSGNIVTKVTAQLAGLFTAAVINSIIMLAFGELRHAPQRAKLPFSFYEKYYKQGLIFPPLLDRNKIYSLYTQLITTKEAKIKLAELLYHAFNDYTWESCYGGDSWAKPVKEALQLLTKKLSLQDILLKIQYLLNVAHNNGWYFNKILNDDILDFVYESELDHIKLNIIASGYAYLRYLYK